MGAAEPGLQAAPLLKRHVQVGGGQFVGALGVQGQRGEGADAHDGAGVAGQGLESGGVPDGAGGVDDEPGVVGGDGGQLVEQGRQARLAVVLAGGAHEEADALGVRQAGQLLDQGGAGGQTHALMLSGPAAGESGWPSRGGRAGAAPSDARGRAQTLSISASSKAISRDCWWFRRGSTSVS